jgi:hypothetical protein
MSVAAKIDGRRIQKMEIMLPAGGSHFTSTKKKAFTVRTCVR